MDVDAIVVVKVRALKDQLLEELRDLDDGSLLSPEAERLLGEYLGISFVAGAKQGGRETIAGFQRQIDEAGKDLTLMLPPALLAENDVV